MKRRIFFLTAILFVLQLTHAVNTIKVNTDYKKIVDNTVAQLDYLHDLNDSSRAGYKPEENWYLYIVGAPLDSLKYYVSETKKSFTANYLIELNEDLKKINSYSSTAVYVAFTDYDRGYLSPILPSDLKTLAAQETFIKKLIENNDTSSYSQDQLTQFEIEISKFRKVFRDLIETVYNKSSLSKIEKPNLLMPSSR